MSRFFHGVKYIVTSINRFLKCKGLCNMGVHSYEETDHLSKPYNITPYRRARYAILQCQRCCKLKNGDVFLGVVCHKKIYAKPLKRCSIKQ